VIELEVRERQTHGKRVRFLRRQGIAPANLYGHGLSSVALEVPSKQLQRLVSQVGKSQLIGLRINGRVPVQALIREIQRDPRTNQLLHVDFYGVRKGEKLKAAVPLVLVGESPAQAVQGGVIVHGITTVEVETEPENLPQCIEVDLSRLTEPDQTIHVRDLSFPPGVEVLTDADEPVAKLTAARREAEEAATAEEAETGAAEGREGGGKE